MSPKNRFFHIPNRQIIAPNIASGSHNEGFYTILMAAVLGLMSSTGVYFLNEKVIKGKAQTSVEETATEARTNNETVKNLISALVSYKNPRSNIYNDPSGYPAGYFKDYFASEATPDLNKPNGLTLVQTAFGKQFGGSNPFYVSSSDTCPNGISGACIAHNNDSWQLGANPFLMFRPLVRTERSAFASLYSGASQGDNFGGSQTQKYSFSLSRANRSSRVVNSITITTSGSVKQHGLLNSMSAKATNNITLPLDPPPNPFGQTMVVRNSGVVSNTVRANAPFDLTVLSRGIADGATASIVGIPTGTDCDVIQNVYKNSKNGGFGKDNWQANSFKNYGNAWDQVWTCQFTAPDIVSQVTKADPAPSQSFPVRYNLSGLNVKDGQDCADTIRKPNGYCNTDSNGVAVSMVKKPNCTLDVLRTNAGSNPISYQWTQLTDWTAQNFPGGFGGNMFLNMNIRGAIYQPLATDNNNNQSTWGAWINYWKMTQSGIWEYQDSSPILTVPFSDTAAAGYSAKPLGDSGKYVFSDATDHDPKPSVWPKWADSDPQKQAIPQNTAINLPIPGLYFLAGNVRGPGGESTCNEASTPNRGTGTYARMWDQAAVSFTSVDNMTTMSGSVAGNISTVDATSSSSVTHTLKFAASEISYCTVDRLDPGSNTWVNVPGCFWDYSFGQSPGDPRGGIFQDVVNLSCPLPALGNRTVDKYTVTCANPTIENVSWFSRGYAQIQLNINNGDPVCSINPSVQNAYDTDPVTVSWSTRNVTSCDVLGYPIDPAGGTYTIPPYQPSGTLTMNCTGPNGPTSCSGTVNRIVYPQPTCALTVSDAPFGADLGDDVTLAANRNFNVNWAMGGADSCNLVRNGSVVSAATGGTILVGPSPGEPALDYFILICSNAKKYCTSEATIHRGAPLTGACTKAPKWYGPHPTGVNRQQMDGLFEGNSGNDSRGILCEWKTMVRFCEQQGYKPALPTLNDVSQDCIDFTSPDNNAICFADATDPKGYKCRGATNPYPIPGFNGKWNNYLRQIHCECAP